MQAIVAQPRPSTSRAQPPRQSAPSQDTNTLTLVRSEVKNLLEASPAFRALSADDRRHIAQETVKVASYMVNPEGLAKQGLSEAAKQNNAVGSDPRQATALAEDPTQQARRAASENRGFAGDDFVPGAVEAGVEQFGEMVKKVDFPKFVSELIKGVFQAIVESSIEQMKAYGELVANVSKSVDQFAQDNISENNARDWLTDQFPGELGVKQSSLAGRGFADGSPAQTPQLEVRGEDTQATLLAITQRLGIEPISDIEEPESERKLVLAARLQMAKGRQQLLASMVMLGINRIVVTNGLIHAKVVFDMRAKDVTARAARASMSDRNQTDSRLKVSAEYGGWYSPYNASVESEVRNQHVATVQSSLDETSESSAEVKANLTGEVRVNFKSDYLPMDKLATPDMIAAIQGNAQPVNPAGVQPAARPATGAPTPAQPAPAPAPRQ